MLTKDEKMWLEEREKRNFQTGYYLSPWAFPKKTLYWVTEISDFYDVAEFEARVAAKMTRITVGDLPCGVDPDNPDCQKPHFRKYNTEERAVGCDMCFIMTARLAVEEEM